MGDSRDSITWNKSTCPYCGLGCGLMVGVEKGKVVNILGMKDHPVNAGKICGIPANFRSLFSAKGRLARPMIRRKSKLVPVTWEEAINHTAARLKKIINDHGPDAIAFYSGSTNLTEEYYLINKLMKGLIGTNNVECSTRLSMTSTAAGFLSTIGVDAPPTCYADVEEADLFFIAGDNMAVSSPVMFQRVTAAKDKNGTKVIVVDPCRSETAAFADIHLQIRPGTDVALNNSLAYVLLREGFVSEDKVEEYASGLEDMKKLIKGYPPSRAAKITGCREDLIVEAAQLIGKAQAMLTFWGQGYSHSTQAVFKNNTLHNLSLLTGNICRPGAGPLPIANKANALGSRWAGSLSHLLPGMRLISSWQHRMDVARYWGVPEGSIQPSPGRSIIDIIKGLHSGEVRCLWVCTSNPAATLPYTRWVEEGLAKAELLVVQDVFHPTETTMLADVVLAGAKWCEKSGTFITSERRVELVEKLIEPPGEAKPDYEIIWLMARAMGYKKEFSYKVSEEVFEEFKGLTRGRICDMGGVTYERLRKSIGPQLPCPDADHPGTPRLFADMRFSRPDGRAALLFRDYIEPAEEANAEYPFILLTRTTACRVQHPSDAAADHFVSLHPEDAAALGIDDGEVIEVVSRRGKTQVMAHTTDSVLPGTIFMPFHYNMLTNPVCDEHSKQPEFKVSAVRLEKPSNTSRI